MTIATPMKLYLFPLICIKSLKKLYLEDNLCTDKYLIQTRSQAKSSGIKLPEVHGMRKNLDPNLKPER